MNSEVKILFVRLSVNAKMIIMRSIIFLIVTSYCICSYGQTENAQQLQKAFHSISSNEMQGWVAEMVHPKYKGRLAGSPEYMGIATWAANLLKEWGIQPFGDDNSYFQYFNRAWCNVKSIGQVKLKISGKWFTLNAPDEYYPGANSFNGSVNAPVVFVGHGITFSEMGYDDYKGIDVKGKIVLLSGDVPYKGKDADTSALWTFYNSHRYKYSNAHEHGAKGVLLVDKMASPGTPYFENFYYAAIEKSVAQLILDTKKLNYDEVLTKISTEMRPFSFETSVTGMIESDIEYFSEGKTANVVGIIEGNDLTLKNEYIIIGAHLDGQGSLGFLLPGALDNASGSADLLAAAKALAMLKGKMKRSIVFVLFGGEECGLLGSLYFAEHPLIPLDKIVLMINLDMVGNGTGLAVWGGESYPDLLAKFESSNNNWIHRSFRSSENKEVKGRPRTDGLVFLMRGVPTVHMGVTDREYPVYYHNHRDDMTVLSWEAMEDAAKLLFLSVYSIAEGE